MKSGLLDSFVRPQTLHSRQLRIRWIVLSAVASLLLAGTLAARVSSSPATAPITLAKGQSVTISVFRLFRDVVRVSLEFERTAGNRRPELGMPPSSTGPGYIEFALPGQPVRMEVSGPDSTIEYEALPGSSHGDRHIIRDLVVRANDADPTRFSWPPRDLVRQALPPGRSTISLTVMEVGEPLFGERVRVIIQPPLSFKSSAPGYGFLWWFFFWPLLALPLACYGAYLAWQTKRLRSQHRG